MGLVPPPPRRLVGSKRKRSGPNNQRTRGEKHEKKNEFRWRGGRVGGVKTHSRGPATMYAISSISSPGLTGGHHHFPFLSRSLTYCNKALLFVTSWSGIPL